MSIVSALALLTSASLAVAEPEWQRSDTFDKDLSFETPCSAEELVVREDGGKEFGSREAEARCEKGSIAFDVQVFEVLTPSKGKPLYDGVLAKFAKERGAKGKAVALTIPGHRAAFDGDEIDGVSGQRGFIEVDSSKLALVMAGGIPGGGADLDTQRKSVARFFDSLRVRD